MDCLFDGDTKEIDSEEFFEDEYGLTPSQGYTYRAEDQSQRNQFTRSKSQTKGIYDSRFKRNSSSKKGHLRDNNLSFTVGNNRVTLNDSNLKTKKKSNLGSIRKHKYREDNNFSFKQIDSKKKSQNSKIFKKRKTFISKQQLSSDDGSRFQEDARHNGSKFHKTSDFKVPSFGFGNPTFDSLSLKNIRP